MQTNYSLINYNRRNIPEMQGLSNNNTRKPVLLCKVTSVKLLVRSMHRFSMKLIKPGHAHNILNLLKNKALSTTTQNITSNDTAAHTTQENNPTENVQNTMLSTSFDETFIKNRFHTSINPVTSALSEYQQQNNPGNNIAGKNAPSDSSQYLDQASSLVVFFESLFVNTPATYFLNSRGIDRRIVLYKSIYCIKNDPYNNTMLTKKCMIVTIKNIISNNKGILSGPKQEAFDIMKTHFPEYNTEKCAIESNENTSFSVVYEIYAGFKFSTDQHAVNKIIFRSENMATRSVEEKKKSRLFTKQQNCDLEIEYKTPKGFVQSLMDILIGRNMQFKGNLVMPSHNDKNVTFKELSTVLQKLRLLIDKVDDQRLMEDLIRHYNRLGKIKNNASLTDEAKIYCFQEELIHGIPLMRQFDPGYNPNLFVFPIKNSPLGDEQRNVAEAFVKQIQLNGGVTYNCTDTKVSILLEQLLPIYLKKREANILNAFSHMHMNDKKLCVFIIKKYAPEFFEQHQLLLEIT